MVLVGAERTKLARPVFLDREAKFIWQPGRLKPRERQVRRKRPLFARHAKFFHRALDIGRQSFQIRRSLDAGPENARAFFVGEEAESAKIECYGLIGARTDERTASGC